MWNFFIFLDIAIFGVFFNINFLYSFYIKTKEVSQLDTKKIGEFLKELRKQNNMTQEVKNLKL